MHSLRWELSKPETVHKASKHSQSQINAKIVQLGVRSETESFEKVRAGIEISARGESRIQQSSLSQLALQNMQKRVDQSGRLQNAHCSSSSGIRSKQTCRWSTGQTFGTIFGRIKSSQSQVGRQKPRQSRQAEEETGQVHGEVRFCSQEQGKLGERDSHALGALSLHFPQVSVLQRSNAQERPSKAFLVQL